MADLTRTWKFARIVPHLGENRDLERPFWLKVKSGLTVSELQAFEAELLPALEVKDGHRAALAAFLGRFIELGDEPLSVNGKPIATLAEYVELLDGVSGIEGLLELIEGVRWANSTAGTKALFSERLSGGSAFTTILPAERAANPRAAR